MQPGRLSQGDPKRSTLLRGFGVLETIVALTVCISLMSLGAKYIGQQADQTLHQITATQLSRVASAAHHYAHDHFEELQRATSSGTAVEWSSQEITQLLVHDNGYLPETLPEHNPYQQHYRMVIQQPQPQLLRLLLLTQGGQIISEAGLRQIAQKAGPSSGYISHLNPQQATGSQEGWQLPLPGPLATPAGHLAAVNYLNANDVLSASNLLFRKKIAGHEAYNRMETDLQMAANIELEDGTTIWFNQGSNRATVIEGGKIALNDGGASTTLQPGKLVVNTAAGVSGDRGIETNSHVVAAGDVGAGRDITVGRDLYAKRIEVNTPDGISGAYGISTNAHIKVDGDLKVGREIYTPKVPTGHLGKNKDLVNNDGTYSVFTDRFIKVPSYIINDRDDSWFHSIGLCSKNSESEGRMYVVGESGKKGRRLAVCLNGEAKSVAGSDGGDGE